MTALFDTSAVVALSKSKEPHHAWALDRFNQFRKLGPVFINDIVFAELSAGVETLDDARNLVEDFGFERLDSNDVSLFKAGQLYKVYKKNTGQKLNVLPDFFIGADAARLKVPLVTLNAEDFLSGFGDLTVIHPNKAT